MLIGEWRFDIQQLFSTEVAGELSLLHPIGELMRALIKVGGRMRDKLGQGCFSGCLSRASVSLSHLGTISFDGRGRFASTSRSWQ